MIYLIGGPPRVGKSILAQKLTVEKGIPFCSTDVIFHMLLRTAPMLGLEEGKGYQNKSKIFYPWLKSFIHMVGYTCENYCIEGDSFLPEYVEQLLNEKDLKQLDIRCVFLGSSQLTHEVMMKNVGKNNWLSDKDKDYRENTVKSTIERSKFLEEECKKYGFKYINLGDNFDKGQEEAFDYLTK